MKSDGDVPVAIIGGGFSGTILAAQLARRGIASTLVDGGGRIGQGTAYSTTDAAHLLNVRAEAMSAWPDSADDFARYFEQQGGDRRDFAQRRLFGRYLQQILAKASDHVRCVAASATGAVRVDTGWRITLEQGETLEAGALVLALGNEPPETLGLARNAGPRFIANPWGEKARTAVAEVAASGGDVLLIGTGLTMVDMVLSLHGAGHQGRILALSRRGLVPRAHAEFQAAPVDRAELPAHDLGALLRWLRQRSGRVGWRAAVDSLRPHSQALWEGFDLAQKRRFLRHARPWWDVHRHRIAPQIASQLADLVAGGRLEFAAGRIVALTGDEKGISLTMRQRGAAGVTERAFACSFNCTGPLGTVTRTRDPLLAGLLADGTVRPDVLGMAIDVDQRSRAADGLWAMGPLTRGHYWEIVAVPDIRGQAAAVADDIATELGR